MGTTNQSIHLQMHGIRSLSMTYRLQGVLWNGTLEHECSSHQLLGYDENGPYASQDLETYYDGVTWSETLR